MISYFFILVSYNEKDIFFSPYIVAYLLKITTLPFLKHKLETINERNFGQPVTLKKLKLKGYMKTYKTF